jgi:hypothetical protein
VIPDLEPVRLVCDPALYRPHERLRNEAVVQVKLRTVTVEVRRHGFLAVGLGGLLVVRAHKPAIPGGLDEHGMRPLLATDAGARIEVAQHHGATGRPEVGVSLQGRHQHLVV